MFRAQYSTWTPAIMLNMITFLVHFFGLDNGSSIGYLFWSGIGSDISEIALIGAVITLYRKHQCHISGCWRLARHPVQQTGIIVCAKHHPEGAPTIETLKNN